MRLRLRPRLPPVFPSGVLQALFTDEDIDDVEIPVLAETAGVDLTSTMEQILDKSAKLQAARLNKCIETVDKLNNKFTALVARINSHGAKAAKGPDATIGIDSVMPEERYQIAKLSVEEERRLNSAARLERQQYLDRAYAEQRARQEERNKMLRAQAEREYAEQQHKNINSIAAAAAREAVAQQQREAATKATAASAAATLNAHTTVQFGAAPKPMSAAGDAGTILPFPAAPQPPHPPKPL